MRFRLFSTFFFAAGLKVLELIMLYVHFVFHQANKSVSTVAEVGIGL